MSYELIVFVNPPNTTGILRTDAGNVYNSHPAIHPTGREGIGFTIEDEPNAHGASLLLEAPNKTSVLQRAILYLNNNTLFGNRYPWTPGQQAAFAVDDFYLQDAFT